MEFSYGTVGHTSMHHVIAGAWQGEDDQTFVPKAERLNVPLCDDHKRCARVIRVPDPHKLCGRCMIVKDHMDQAADASLGLFPQDFLEERVALGWLYVNHSVDPKTGRKLQRPFSVTNPVLTGTFEMNRWLVDPPWVVDHGHEEECACLACRRPKDGQRTSGTHHIARGQHQTVALRRALAVTGWSGQEIADVPVPVKVWKTDGDWRQLAAELILWAERDRRQHSNRDIRAFEAAAGEPVARAAESALLANKLTFTGRNRLSASHQFLSQVARFPADRQESAAHRILGIPLRAWPDVKSPKAPVLRAVSEILLVNWQADDERLVRILSYRRLRMEGMPGYKELTGFLVSQYNSGSKYSVDTASKKLRMPW